MIFSSVQTSVLKMNLVKWVRIYWAVIGGKKTFHGSDTNPLSNSYPGCAMLKSC